MEIKTFYDKRTDTLTYVVFDPKTKDGVVIDPVLDYEPVGSKIWTESVDTVIRFIEAQGLNLHYILETHAHADHLSGAQMLKERFPAAKTAIGERITEVQSIFKAVFALPDDFKTDGSQFDMLLADGQVVHAGPLSIETMFTPGHTPACATYKIGDAIFTGDALFMPDGGTGRCDFPGGSAESMWCSIQERIYTLPPETRVFVGHDYQPDGRDLAFESTVGEEREKNVQLPARISKEDFVARRRKRDKTLRAPRLLFQSVQVNIDAGALPAPTANEKRFLRIPINVFRPAPAGHLEYHEVD
jgi:glyoxylase-like metal-dependent hydrolase (beta-lactamase superfamily II)